ncbi:MAG: hypothetical protein LBT09_00895 [Planctomycetaceae bacterium]|jgi:hypothetical protein|nr:hypothetical protein [Planctomycetaceae bacterium]
MTLFDDERYAWRETYFVLFEPAMRPRFVDVRRNFDIHAGCFSMLDKKVGNDDAMESITIASYEDHAAIEVVYSEGEIVLSESNALFATISKDCPARERELLRKAKKLSARYSVLHFEQVAGTGVFKTIKKPELQFVSPLDRAVKRATNASLKKIKRNNSNEILAQKEIGTNRSKFHFDPVSYKNCSFGGERFEVFDDDIENERIDPNTLILILDVLCTMTHGIAIDPASGIVCGDNMN